MNKQDQFEVLPLSYKLSEKAMYSNSKTISNYVDSFDGTKLAVDITFPIHKEGDSIACLPVILIANRSNRRSRDDYEINLGYNLVPYGYIFVSLELRGVGASFGVNNSFGNEEHCKDLISIAEWISAQTWCDSHIGMLGCSNRAYIQFCTASHGGGKISAITPVVAAPDFYYQNYPNGVSAVPSFRMPLPSHKLTKEELLLSVTPVDEDPDGDLAYQAYLQDHYLNNKDFFETLIIENLNRDSKHPNYHDEKVFDTIPPIGKMEDFFAKGIKQHQFIGQLESSTLEQLAHFINYGGSVCLGPWTHFGGCICESDYPNGSLDLVQVYRKWYDYALKEKKNGFDQAPPISYYMFHADPGSEWRVSESWPPENEMRTILYLNSGKSETCRSINDGSLTLSRPLQEAKTEYLIRDDICVFKNEQGKSTYNRSELFYDSDMTQEVDEKGLTFTSAPLFPVYTNEFAGCISIDLWVSCNANDVDLITYVEEIFPDGTSHYIKDGVMRASHRTIRPNKAWEKMGATCHSSLTEDVDNCLVEGLNNPTHIQFAIDPIAYHFYPQSRIRITITCANNAAFQHYMYQNGYPTLTLYTGGSYSSHISIPFLDDCISTYKGTLENTNAPATLYVFKNHVYLYEQGMWHKYKNTNEFKTRDYGVYLENETVVFHPLGYPDTVAHLPYETFEAQTPHHFPAFRRQYVSTEEIESRDYTLFAPGHKKLVLDVFKNENVTNAPCIVYIHGYGFPYCALLPQLNLLLDHGYAVAAIDIRNYPPNRFPDYIHDAKAAIRYLRSHADKFGINPNKFASYGVSLGGNTALMLALTGNNRELEGCVGGNLEYSSELQACAAGYAWSDLLNMGKDIREEYVHQPDIAKARLEMTDGEFSPSSEVIGFAGKGKGLGVLRRYKEGGCQPSNPEYDQKLEEAYYASPINHVTKSVPPIALMGGHGMDNVNIAFKQTLRTFEALNKVGALTFIYANTNGQYAEKDETLMAIKAFFDKHLKEIELS